MTDEYHFKKSVGMLLLISLCLVGALSTWFSATVVLSEISIHAKLIKSQEVWLTNGVQIGFVIGALIIAFFNLSDTISLKFLIALSCAIAGLANLLILWASNPVGVIGLRCITGAALSGVYPPAVKLIATWFKKGRGIAMGTIIGALTIGSATPHLLRALATETDWILVIWGSSIATFGAGLIFMIFVSEGPFAFARTQFNPRQIIQILGNRSINLVNIGYIGHMWELYAMWAWILTFSQFAGLKFENFPFGTPEYFSFFVVSVGAIGCIIAGRLSDVYGRCYSTAALMLVSGTCAISIGFLIDTSAFLFALVALIWGITIIADSGQFSTAITELSEPELIGTAVTFQMALGFGVTIIAIWFVPFTAQLFGNMQWAFILLAPGPFIGAIAMLFLRKLPEAEKLALGNR